MRSLLTNQEHFNFACVQKVYKKDSPSGCCKLSWIHSAQLKILSKDTNEGEFMASASTEVDCYLFQTCLWTNRKVSVQQFAWHQSSTRTRLSLVSLEYHLWEKLGFQEQYALFQTRRPLMFTFSRKSFEGLDVIIKPREVIRYLFSGL